MFQFTQLFVLISITHTSPGGGKTDVLCHHFFFWNRKIDGGDHEVTNALQRILKDRNRLFFMRGPAIRFIFGVNSFLICKELFEGNIHK